MALFSERYGYTKASDVLIREKMTEAIENALCSGFDLLEESLKKIDCSNNGPFVRMELFLWTNFLNQRRNDFFFGYGRHQIVATTVLNNDKMAWHRKLSMLELSVQWLLENGKNYQGLKSIARNFVSFINCEFERLNYAYRFVGNEIVPITSKKEIDTIELAAKASENNVSMHLQSALDLLAKKPVGDYRNSIKESITAVEAVCRDMTSKDTLGDALNELKKSGMDIPNVLKIGFEKLYGYTNDKETGIRHALMDKEGSYIPSSAEAIFMLVSCSAFINYLNAKRAK